MRRALKLLPVSLAAATALTAQVTLPSPIDDTSFGPLQTGVTYVANADVSVTPGQTLTIQPGAVIKFAAPTAEFLVRNGAILNAVGTPAQPIVFTSIHDDTVGVALGTRVPAAADWDDLEFNSSGGGLVQFAEVRYAGSVSNPSIVIAQSSVVIRDCVVRDGDGDGIQADGTPTIERCAIRNCKEFAIDRVTLTNLPNVRDNVASGPGANTVRLVAGRYAGTISVGPENGINGEVYVPGTLEINGVGSSLTLRAGLIVKLTNVLNAFGGATVSVLGQPTSRVVFTSPQDDSVGNDTLGDGPTTGMPGDWTDLRFQSPGSVLENADIRFAGAGNTPGAVRGLNGAFRMTGCTVESCATEGISLTGSVPTIQGCAIRNCGGRAIEGARVDALPRFSGNTATGCAGGNSLYTTFRQTGTAPLLVSATIGPDNLLGGEFVASNLDVRGASTVLTLQAGVIVKVSASVSASQGATIQAQGTAQQPVVITSLADDSVGNDALGDGPTVGAPGDWGIVNLSSSGSNFAGTMFRFGGSGFSNNAMVVLQGAVSATFRDCVVEGSLKAGIDLLGSQLRPGTVVERCDFRNNTFRPLSNVAWHEVPVLLDNTGSGNGLGDHLVVVGERFTGDVAVYLSNTINGNGVIVTSGVSTAGGQEFVAGPGLKLKVAGSLGGAGRLALDGRGDRPIFVTSQRDDSIGGDTNNDGAATVPAPGDWGGIRYTSAGTVSGYLAHVHCRYGGGGFSNTTTVYCENPSVRITSTRVDFSQRLGFQVRNLQSPGANWIAFGCQSAGISLLSGDFTVQHATSTENVGVGIFGDQGYSGVVYSSIAWNNGRRVVQDNFVTVRHTKCNGSNESGNINADPMFANAPGGDLHISPFSLCVGRGDLPQATLWGVDFDGNSRILDHALNGLALPDIGAFEVFQYRMGIDSELRVGRTTSFTIAGPGPTQGFQVVFLGPAVSGMFVPPFGVLVTGTLLDSTILFVQPTGTPFALAIPDAPHLIGARLGLQTLVITELSIPAGGLTNALLASIGR
ncbi:MAG: hypothetical protein R3F56_23130 [Planctomycetota bacterium]